MTEPETTTDVERKLVGWIEEALELRHGVAGDPAGTLADAPEDTPAEIMELLSRVRKRSDRVDELMSLSTIARGRARRAREHATFVADNAVSQATQVEAARRIEFSSAKEREATAKLAAFAERREAFLRNRLVSNADDAYEVISQIHWQLDAIRKDLRARLHALQFDAGLER